MRLTTEEFCKAAEKHGLTVNFGVAKTEALQVLRGAGKNKVNCEIKRKKPIIRCCWSRSQDCRAVQAHAQCVRVVVRWALRCRGERRSWRRASFTAVRRGHLLPLGHAIRLEGVQMRWTRKAVKRHRGEGGSETDAQIRAEFSIATVESKIRCRRLGFQAQLHTASPMLRALLQEGVDLIAWQAAQPKASAMPHPAGDVDVWISWLWRTR